MSSPAADLPERLGPYEVLAEIGRGAAGIVLRGRDSAGDGVVALKTVLSADEAALSSLRREYATLRRLAHPGIVRIVAEGLHESRPWYAMEEVEGDTLLSFTSKATSSGATLGDVLTPLLGLCRVLGYLHGEGVVHRDLKPRNVVVRADGSVALVDFGVTALWGGSAGREAMDAGGDVVGTLAYMAPEQWRGEYVDARADLYAFGAILFGILTGQPPYRTLRDYQDPSVAPPAPSSLRPGVPVDLDRLVARLLARSPEDRLGYADDVERELVRLGARPPSWSEPPRRTYLYRPGLSGRDDARALGEGLLSQVCTGQGSALLLAGESGVGKTRLLLELSRLARRQGMTVLVAECPPAGLARPLQALAPWMQLLADRCRGRSEPEVAQVLGGSGRLLATYFPVLETLPGVAGQPEPPDLPPEAARLRLFSALADALHALAAREPLLAIMDDAQWADELSLASLVHLLSGGMRQGTPLGIVVAYRSEEAPAPLQGLRGPGGSPRDAIPGPQIQRLHLKRLSEDAVGAMASDMLALRPMPPALGSFLARVSEGNPFFVAEYLRTAVTAGLLRREEGRWRLLGEEATVARFDDLPLPSGLSELVARHLSLLSPTARAVLEAASVLGRECAAPLLAAASGTTEEDALDLVAELLGRQLLEERPPWLRFAHDKVREVAYGMLSDEARRALHRRAAEGIVRLYGPEPPDLLGDLGRHWARAGEPADAAPLLLQAARRAASAYAFEDAERLYRERMALPLPASRELVDAEVELASRVLLLRGRTGDAIRLHQRAVARARRLQDEATLARTLRLLGVASQAGSRAAEAERALVQALGIFERLGDEPAQALALSSIAQLALHQGRIEQAAATYGRALDLAERAADAPLQAEIMGHLAVFHWEQGRVDEAAAWFDQALRIHVSSGDRLRQARVRGNLASLHHNRGRIGLARRLYEEAAATLRDVGDVRAEGIVLGNLAICLQEEGRMAESAAMLGQALRIARQVGDRRVEARTLASLAVLHHTQGRLAEAAAHYEEAVAIARRVRDRALEGHALGNLAELRHDQGRRSDAAALYRRAIARHRQVGDRRLEGHALGNLGELRRQLGRVSEARALLGQALALSREVGDRQAEGLTLCRLAALARQEGDAAAAARHLEQARPILEEVGEKQTLLTWTVESGRQALAAGASAEVELERARGLALALGAGPDSAAARMVASLADAVAAASRGERLLRGELTVPRRGPRGRNRRE